MANRIRNGDELHATRKRLDELQHLRLLRDLETDELTEYRVLCRLEARLLNRKAGGP